MPMMHMSYRFPDGAPEREVFLHEVTRQFGPATERTLEDVVRDGHVLSFNAMDLIGLVYAARVCERFGGIATDFSGADVALVLPAWSQHPWTHYTLWRRLRIRCGRIRLGPPSSP